MSRRGCSLGQSRALNPEPALGHTVDHLPRALSHFFSLHVAPASSLTPLPCQVDQRPPRLFESPRGFLLGGEALEQSRQGLSGPDSLSTYSGNHSLSQDCGPCLKASSHRLHTHSLPSFCLRNCSVVGPPPPFQGSDPGFTTY